MPTDLKIDYLELMADDFEVIQAFYQRAFNWSFTDYGPDYVAFSDGKIEGGFRRSQQRSSTQNGAALIILYALDLEGTREIVLSSGGKVIQDIFAFPGGRRFHFTDPHGNELAVWSDQ